MYPEITMRGERILVVLRLMVKKRERWKKKAPSLVVGGGLYKVCHPLTSYVTKWGMNAIIPGHYKTVMLTIGLRISE